MEGIYDKDTGTLIEAGINHLEYKEYRHWKQVWMRRAEEAKKEEERRQ